MPRLAVQLRAALAAALVSTPLTAGAATKLPQAADAALTSAEKLLGKTTGDDRVVACFDAVSFLQIVYQYVPDYAYATGLYGECLYLTDNCELGSKVLERYIGLVPESARKGPVAEKVARAQERLHDCRLRLGLADTPLAAKAETKPVETKPAENKPIEAPPADAAKGPEEFVLPPPDDRVAPPPPAQERAAWPLLFAVRGGYGPLAGGLGLSGEARWGPVGLVVGSGGYPFAAGLSFARPAGTGGLYVDLHAVRTGSSLLVERRGAGTGLGATVGYDWRPLPFLSVKVGLGGGWVLGDGRLQGGVVTGDLLVGPVFKL